MVKFDWGDAREDLARWLQEITGRRVTASTFAASNLGRRDVSTYWSG